MNLDKKVKDNEDRQKKSPFKDDLAQSSEALSDDESIGENVIENSEAEQQRKDALTERD